MDPATLIGVIVGLIVIVIANILEGGNPASLLLVAPLLLVFGTTILVSMAGGTMGDAKAAAKAFGYAFTAKVRPAGGVVPTVVSLAEKARKEGLLALEDQLKDIDDPFLVKGVTMAIDGTDPEELRDILEAEVYAKKQHDKHGAKFFADAGAYAPTIGIIGTVMGLVHVLENLAKPEELGHLIAAAFIATLWGVMSANVIWLPVGNRLKRLAELEAARMELIIEGISAIQAGLEPAGRRPEAALAPARRDRAGRGGVTCPQASSSPEAPGGARGAREPRALAGHVRRHGHAAHGAVHRHVRDELVDQRKFNALKEGLAAGFGALDGDPRGVQQHPRPARHVRRRHDRGQRGHPRHVAGGEEEVRAGPARRSPGSSRERQYAEAAAEVTGLQGLLKKIDAALRAKGLRDDVRAAHRRARPGHQPGVQARRRSSPTWPTLSDRGEEVLDTIAPVLLEAGDRLEIDGHTNQVPVKPKYYPTDWELSAARAVTVLRYLNEACGIAERPDDRVGVRARAAADRPVRARVAGSINKRVDIVVEPELAEETRAAARRVVADRRRARPPARTTTAPAATPRRTSTDHDTRPPRTAAAGPRTEALQ